MHTRRPCSHPTPCVSWCSISALMRHHGGPSPSSIPCAICSTTALCSMTTIYVRPLKHEKAFQARWKEFTGFVELDVLAFGTTVLPKAMDGSSPFVSCV